MILSGKTVVSAYMPQPPTPNNININYASTATLTATPNTLGSIIDWYNSSTDTTLLKSGTSFTTQVLFDTTTYFLASRGGKADLKITELRMNEGGYRYNGELACMGDRS